MSSAERFSPPSDLASSAHITAEKYQTLYAESISNPDSFWGRMAERLDWITPPTKINNSSFEGDVSIKWYEDGVLNACYNCVDRHLPARADQTALLWEGDDPANSEAITYAKMKDEICRLANALKEKGVRKGDRVTIYMPMIPQAVYAMLACARIGAIHSVVFGGFAAHNLAIRMSDAEAKVVITVDAGLRGGKVINYKNLVNQGVGRSVCKT